MQTERLWSGWAVRTPRLIWVFPGSTDHFVGFVMRRLECNMHMNQMDGWVRVLHPFQQYFSHFEAMEGWTWKALCNEAPFRFGKNLASSGIRTHGRRSRALTVRACGCFMWTRTVYISPILSCWIFISKSILNFKSHWKQFEEDDVKFPKVRVVLKIHFCKTSQNTFMYKKWPAWLSELPFKCYL